MGNQLTTDKIKQINMLDPLPYEEPEEEIPEEMEVKDEVSLTDENTTITLDDDGQITLTLE